MDAVPRPACPVRTHTIGRILFAAVALFVASTTWAAWTPERLDAVTEYMRQFRKDWTRADTDELVTNGPKRAVNLAGSVSSGLIYDDKGGRVAIVITGDSMLVNGKDISGNLGSKTTHGANSPIIENIRNSQIATAEHSTATNAATSHVTVNVSLSIALFH